MDSIFSYNQEKIDKFKNSNICNLELFYFNNSIKFIGYYNFEYFKDEAKKAISYIFEFEINLQSGDVQINYKIKNHNLFDELKMFRNCDISKKNDFKLLYDVTENGVYRGEKRSGYWGVKYYHAINRMIQTIYDILKPNFTSEYLLDKIKTPEKCYMNELFDLIVDFHLDKKKIKGHDTVYHHIQHDYPKKKWLKRNDNKFLPSVLDSYGIKSKFLIGKLNGVYGKAINISSLNYICKLFGKNYITYLKQINWERHCFDTPPNKRTHELKNDSEKKIMVKMINNWEVENVRLDSLVYSVNKLLSIREELEKSELDLKFNAKSDVEFELLMGIWQGYKQYINRGYKLKYEFPFEFINEIEQPIVIGEMVYKPKVLLSEDDFRQEGFTMKNCMSKQFMHGLFSIFISLQKGKKRINLQFRKGNIIQSYGKANSPVPEEYNDVMNLLTSKLLKYQNITWQKIKYDIISN